MVELRKRKLAPPPDTEASEPASALKRTKPTTERKTRVTRNGNLVNLRAKTKPKAKHKSFTKPASTVPEPSQHQPLATGDTIPLDIQLDLHSSGQPRRKVSLGDVLAKSNKNGLVVFVFGKALSEKTDEFINEIDYSMFHNEGQMTIIGLSPDKAVNISKLQKSNNGYEYLGDPRKQLLALLGLGDISPTDKKGHVGVFIVGKGGELLLLTRNGRMEGILEQFIRGMDVVIHEMGWLKEEDDDNEF